MSTSGPPFRVLVVDDNVDVADSTAVLLAITGFDARACYDGPTALKEVARFRPGVCLIDLNMPGMDGDELAIQIQKSALHRRTLLVAITAMSDEESRHRIWEAGFHLHLIKPVDPLKMVEIVDAQWHRLTSGHPGRLSEAEV